MTQVRAVTFDFGQVLAEFDPVHFAQKLASQSIPTPSVDSIERALPRAWDDYGRALRDNLPHGGPWKVFIASIMEQCDQSEYATPALLDWLFIDQRAHNLWRRPIKGMIDLVRLIRKSGLKVAIVSNSEGALKSLVQSMGWLDDFEVIADSGLLGFEKPDRRIFLWAAAQLGVETNQTIHIGDSWVADVEGAVGVGAGAIWYPAGQKENPFRRVEFASTVDEIQRKLRLLGADF